MLAHLPVLQVVVPLMAAPLCWFLNRSKLVWIFALLVCSATCINSIILLIEVMKSGTITYELGGWEAPWGIEYRIDKLNAFLLLIISTIGTVVLFAANTSIQKELDEDRHTLFYSLYLLSLTGMFGIVATGDAFNVFVFLEISSLSSYALIALGKDRRALWAAYQYLIMGTIGATFILIGIGMLYQMTGTLNMSDLAVRLVDVGHTRTVFAAFAFLIVGICLKLALFPLHLWLPNAYAYAPSIVTAFLAATSTKVAVYLLIRFTFTVLGISFSFTTLPLQSILMVLGLIGVFAASITAIYQQNVKHILAYSSIAQVGYMIIGYSINTSTGIMATLLHLFNHALMKGALFLALGAVMYRIGSVQLKQFQGLGKQMPLTMSAIVIGGLSLIGVPLTVGFVSKWYLLIASVEAGMWPVAVLILLGSLLAIIYIWRIVEMAYFKPPLNGCETVKEAPWTFLAPIWALIFANIYFGIDTRLSVQVAQAASQSLFGITP
ncbi:MULTISPECIES: monovalent cation/H+ antiporter subunit D family protein [unclassified Shewanella]|uniref:monovalent cation/H+ antiporter subunit D family protein n=2 Tax=Shewanella TaxID=22 RepID=UPI000C842056|nr:MULTISPECIES: monovalent cation/H+ antiporter subunit D family protein [unclassified Shewanella]MDO6621003.1 monovalent cation/H+ antiporter subunit D family protein [Shewanella sp. 6_MG-2023]MDO6639236.1 monovalent cation/H+ antiporter subunit D family protein [Shewanella sp. 5_MG-2023]MDO6677488.1 monovalent cation/H+ antiporter subunit D family protein [Shewanella sp. 4_MG-2023]MDO6774932.1 monovalent cation/H+ antiporter subunit D family protein [Shewanella sp. 3_MG-2023]PMG29397.1 cati